MANDRFSQDEKDTSQSEDEEVLAVEEAKEQQKEEYEKEKEEEGVVSTTMLLEQTKKNNLKWKQFSAKDKITGLRCSNVIRYFIFSLQSFCVASNAFITQK